MKSVSPSTWFVSPLEWTGWGEEYEYVRDEWYEYGGEPWSPDKPSWGGWYEYGGGALPFDKPSVGGGGYKYVGYPYCGGGGMNMVEERPSNYWPDVEGIDRENTDMEEDMMVEMEVVKREHVSMVLTRH
jgi:hypothetical protein